MFIPPLLALPLIVYNLIGLFAFGDGSGWTGEIASIPLVSGATWPISSADVFIIVSLVLLFGEILKATRFGNASVIDHMLSTAVFIICLIEFLLVPFCGTSAFFILMVMALIDVIAGFTVSIRAAARDVQFGGLEQ
ncbi:hypothetical protein [Pelagibacterium xiamenense]|uniref:hypothetical protein n=1 Tax=Pelagibacterium xiamenense TaxID=2901140 RepID=UPI001E3E76BA|nr:hypothetical protein [Pelagibacterium xiamenense]MCD7061335.1 hypothetical protein [Pelagibacterium xiamenense]